MYTGGYVQPEQAYQGMPSWDPRQSEDWYPVPPNDQPRGWDNFQGPEQTAIGPQAYPGAMLILKNDFLYF